MFENIRVVVTGPFINFLLHNHFITEIFLKKKSGDNDEANFSLFMILLQQNTEERAKPILPPYDGCKGGVKGLSSRAEGRERVRGLSSRGGGGL